MAVPKWSSTRFIGNQPHIEIYHLPDTSYVKSAMLQCRDEGGPIKTVVLRMFHRVSFWIAPAFWSPMKIYGLQFSCAL